MVFLGPIAAIRRAAPEKPFERCEWNPTRNRLTWSNENDCPNRATVCLGHNPSYHLCDSCASLPRFKRYRKRTSLSE
jgi:hypothetical protein